MYGEGGGRERIRVSRQRRSGKKESLEALIKGIVAFDFCVCARARVPCAKHLLALLIRALFNDVI